MITDDRRREIQELVDVTSWGDWASASEPFENVAAGASAISAFLMRSAKVNDSGDVYAVVSVERERRGRNPDLLEALQIGQPEDLVLVAVCGFGEHGKNNAVFMSTARRAVLDLLEDNAELRRQLSEQAELKEALREITEPRGKHSPDPLTHANNTIEHMVEIAHEALKERNENT